VEIGILRMKNKTHKSFAIFSTLVFLTFVLFAQETFPQSQKSFLWRVQSKTNTVYVLGSLHFSKREVYPLNPQIERAFDQSEFLVVEANINDIGKMDIQKMIESAFYPADDTLERHVTAETYEWVKKEMSGLGIPLELINKQRPWFLAMTLASLESLKLGLDANLGIDKYFLTKAEGKKKIFELESLDYQIDLLSSLSDKDQELFLLYTLKDLKLMEEELSKLVQAWISGDAKGMESLLTKGISEDARLSSIFDKLVYERNKAMALKIEGFLRTQETYFVIVGAGHLVGDQGIIEILKGKGYLIEQL
jgi:uncharacterized protein YbaP (TraB family)